MENCVFKKILLQDNIQIRIHVTLVENSVQLIVLQKQKAWKSFVTAEDLNCFAEQHRLSAQNYCEKLLQYIKAPNSCIIFILKEDRFVINRLLDNNLKVKYFTCNLEKVNYVEHVEQIMDKFYSENIKYFEKLDTITKDRDEIEKEKTSCELKLNELIEKKKIDEDEQFGRFMLILNEKKHRIQHLTELLEAFKGGRPTTNPPVEIKISKKKQNKKNPPPKKLETISESEPESSEEVATDDSSTDEKPTVKKFDEPSTSAYNFLEDDDIPQSCILPKRVKYESTSSMIVPTTSKPTEVKLEDEPKKATRSDSPSIDISTQQLLDML